MNKKDELKIYGPPALVLFIVSLILYYLEVYGGPYEKLERITGNVSMVTLMVVLWWTFFRYEKIEKKLPKRVKWLLVFLSFMFFLGFTANIILLISTQIFKEMVRYS